MTPELELILAYFKDLQERNFYGTIEFTFQNGHMAYSRENRSVQDFELVVELMDKLSKSAREQLEAKYSTNPKFKKALQNKKLT